MHEDTHALVDKVTKVLPPMMVHRWEQYDFWTQVTIMMSLRKVFSHKVTPAEERIQRDYDKVL